MHRTWIALALLLALATAGCGDGPPGEEGTTPSGRSASPGTPTTPAADTPQAIGEAVAGIYVATMQEVTAALESRPEPAAAKAELERIKAQAVERLVQLGRKRAALDEAGRAVVNQKVQSAMMHLPAGLFDAFSQAHKHYRGVDRETANLLSSFNVITQYADFELLKKQEPKEFERLGLGD